jgi:hypothetical protein
MLSPPDLNVGEFQSSLCPLLIRFIYKPPFVSLFRSLRTAMCLIAWLLLASLTVVAGIPVDHVKRQTWTGWDSYDFTVFGCRPVIFIFARETIAPGNMVQQT